MKFKKTDKELQFAKLEKKSFTMEKKFSNPKTFLLIVLLKYICNFSKVSESLFRNY